MKKLNKEILEDVSGGKDWGYVKNLNEITSSAEGDTCTLIKEVVPSSSLGKDQLIEIGGISCSSFKYTKGSWKLILS